MTAHASQELQIISGLNEKKNYVLVDGVAFGPR